MSARNAAGLRTRHRQRRDRRPRRPSPLEDRRGHRRLDRPDDDQRLSRALQLVYAQTGAIDHGSSADVFDFPHNYNQNQPKRRLCVLRPAMVPRPRRHRPRPARGRSRSRTPTDLLAFNSGITPTRPDAKTPAQLEAELDRRPVGRQVDRLAPGVGRGRPGRRLATSSPIALSGSASAIERPEPPRRRIRTLEGREVASRRLHDRPPPRRPTRPPA